MMSSINEVVRGLCGISFVVATLGSPVVAQERSQPAKATPSDAQKSNEAKVYDAIAEMVVRRDQLVKKFAVVFHGEATVTGDPEEPVFSHPDVMARVVDRSRDFDVRARYAVKYTNFEFGWEVLSTRGQYKAKSAKTLLKGPYDVKPAEIDAEQWLQEYPAGGIDPFDDYLAGTSGFAWPDEFRFIENKVLSEWKLQTVEEGVGGVLVSRWKHQANPETAFDIRVDFSPAVEMMPVRISSEASDPKGFVQETRIEWQRYKDTLVPFRMTLAITDASNVNMMTEYQYRCYWLIGDEVPDKIFQAEDHLAALLDHFEITHTTVVNGEVVHVEHKLPKDLYKPTK